jgi:hypothetical protein
MKHGHIPLPLIHTPHSYTKQIYRPKGNCVEVAIRYSGVIVIAPQASDFDFTFTTRTYVGTHDGQTVGHSSQRLDTADSSGGHCRKELWSCAPTKPSQSYTYLPPWLHHHRKSSPWEFHVPIKRRRGTRHTSYTLRAWLVVGMSEEMQPLIHFVQVVWLETISTPHQLWSKVFGVGLPTNRVSTNAMVVWLHPVCWIRSPPTLFGALTQFAI